MAAVIAFLRVPLTLIPECWHCTKTNQQDAELIEVITFILAKFLLTVHSLADFLYRNEHVCSNRNVLHGLTNPLQKA